MQKTIFLVALVAVCGAFYWVKKPQTTPSDMLKNTEKLTETTQKIQDTEGGGVASEKMQGLTTDYLMGKFDPATSTDFVEVERKYAVREAMYLRKETYEAFKKMYAAAEKEGFKLTVLSATRHFTNQKNIWETKWHKLQNTVADPTARARKILEYSSMPGSSRHHWGTDIDLANLTNAYFDTGNGKKMYAWMLKNAASFGFCQPYTAGRPTGYFEEKWHWSYMPLSKKMTDFAEKNLKNEMIKGFLGSETAVDIDIVKNYVLGINNGCRH